MTIDNFNWTDTRLLKPLELVAVCGQYDIMIMEHGDHYSWSVWKRDLKGNRKDYSTACGITTTLDYAKKMAVDSAMFAPI